MKISLSWLKEWVDCNLSAAALGERLTMAGLELEGISAAAPAFDGVVVGEVLEVRPHPAAAKLKLCSVAGGSAEPLTIVCGAPNVRSGMRVPLARIGARMPDGRVIERAELRGILSQGTLCSARELGLSEQSEGLMVLTADA